jgi:DNA (cytosine-5)-methyltransferase 1
LGTGTAVVDLKDLYLLYDEEENEQPWILGYHNHLNSGGLGSSYEDIPSYIQRITAEQAAAIQTFPVGYKFTGGLVSQFKQIGNAVPVNMAYQIALMINDCLSSNNLRDKVIPIIK